MTYLKKSPFEFSVEELDRELLVRTARVPMAERFKFSDPEGGPARDTVMAEVQQLYEKAVSLSPDDGLSHIETSELIKVLAFKTREIDNSRGVWGMENRQDIHELLDNKEKDGVGEILKNADGVAALCMQNDVSADGPEHSKLRVKHYGKLFNLCDSEPFHNQLIGAGYMATAFLVEEDVIATAGHCATPKNLADLRFAFGFKMEDGSTPVIRLPNEDIYKGVEITHRVYDRDTGSDWALVRLDRNVTGRSVVNLHRGEISLDREVYVIGHPVGLPLKYSAGSFVRATGDFCFTADLNVYSGNSGSPVFDVETHDVIGLVARGDNRDFRWTGGGWRSIIYPALDIASKEPQCTRVSQFSQFVPELEE